jgi:hypothetical protein
VRDSQQRDNERLRFLYAERVREQDARHPGYADAWSSFAALVLQHGGDLVVPPTEPDVMVDMLTATGALIRPAEVSTRRGSASDCHANAVHLWRVGTASALGTGYALSDDGLWREHSWAWDPSGALIETTEPRTRYFGIRMDGDLAEWFADWIAPGESPA